MGEHSFKTVKWKNQRKIVIQPDLLSNQGGIFWGKYWKITLPKTMQNTVFITNGPPSKILIVDVYKMLWSVIYQFEMVVTKDDCMKKTNIFYQ